MFTIRTKLNPVSGVRVVFQNAEQAATVIEKVVKNQKLVRADRELLQKVAPEELKKIQKDTLTGLKNFLSQYKDNRFVSNEFKTFARKC